jgi:hypothetical protein
VPLFVFALVARRGQKVAGILLPSASAFLLHFFGLSTVLREDPTKMGRIQLIVRFIGRLTASGIAVFAAQARHRPPCFPESEELPSRQTR